MEEHVCEREELILASSTARMSLCVRFDSPRIFHEALARLPVSFHTFYDAFRIFKKVQRGVRERRRGGSAGVAHAVTSPGSRSLSAALAPLSLASTSPLAPPFSLSSYLPFSLFWPPPVPFACLHLASCLSLHLHSLASSSLPAPPSSLSCSPPALSVALLLAFCLSKPLSLAYPTAVALASPVLASPSANRFPSAGSASLCS